MTMPPPIAAIRAAATSTGRSHRRVAGTAAIGADDTGCPTTPPGQTRCRAPIETARPILLEAVLDDAVESWGEIRTYRGEVRRVLFQDGRDRVGSGVAVKGRAPQSIS